jgi:hypothetical protein
MDSVVRVRRWSSTSRNMAPCGGHFSTERIQGQGRYANPMCRAGFASKRGASAALNGEVGLEVLLVGAPRFERGTPCAQGGFRSLA